MESKDLMKIINDTLEQLEKKAGDCLEKNDVKNAQMFLDYALGIRMVLDNIELSK